MFFSMQQHVRLHPWFKTKMCNCEVGPKIFSQYFNVCLQKGSEKGWYCIPANGSKNSFHVNGNEKKNSIDTFGESGVKIKQEQSPECDVAGEILKKQTALFRDVRVNTGHFNPNNLLNIEKKSFVAKRIEAPKMSIKSRLSLLNQKSVNHSQASGSSAQSRARVTGNFLFNET